MNTCVIRVSPNNIDKKELGKAARLLKKGELVAFPTETVYGLGSNALSASAVKKIFKAKGRPSDNPLIIHIADIKMLKDLTLEVSPLAHALIKKFWPGPLTLVFRKTSKVPKIATGGLDTVAIRMPNHPIALALIKSSGCCLAAPSANTSGKPSSTSAFHVASDFDGKIAGIVDGGKTKIGIESTVVDVSEDDVVLLRPGSVTIDQINSVVSKFGKSVKLFSKKTKKAKSPGMKYKHYEPQAQLVLIENNKAALRKEINKLIKKYQKQKKKVGVLSMVKADKFTSADTFLFIGSTKKTIAKNLFASFRTMDELGMDIILMQTLDEKGLGLGIMNRVKKAAKKTIKV